MTVWLILDYSAKNSIISRDFLKHAGLAEHNVHKETVIGIGGR
jgi:hypothetical protein